MRRNLVIQLARFGDLVQTKRLMLSLAAEPESETHLCLDVSLAPLARLLYPHAVLHPILAHGTHCAGLPPVEQARAVLGTNVPAFRILKDLAFDRIYNLNFSPLNFRVAALFDPQRVCGYVWQNGQEEVGQWSRLAMRWSSLRRIGLNLIDFWAWHHPFPVAPESVNPPAEAGGGGLGVVLAGREPRRSLPPQILARLVSGLHELHGGGIILFGGTAESAAARRLLHELPPKHLHSVRDLCGATDWPGLVAALRGLDLLLTPDTGTMHLAAALGVPVLATFLSSAWCFETGPYGLGHHVLQANLTCAPCLESRPCGLGVRCLAPFADPRVLRLLATGEARHLPEGLTFYRSRLDDLGLDFTPLAGPDDFAQLRARFRSFLARHLGRGGNWADPAVGDLAERLYSGTDWLVPDPESSSGRFTSFFGLKPAP